MGGKKVHFNKKLTSVESKIKYIIEKNKHWNLACPYDCRDFIFTCCIFKTYTGKTFHQLTLAREEIKNKLETSKHTDVLACLLDFSAHKYNDIYVHPMKIQHPSLWPIVYLKLSYFNNQNYIHYILQFDAMMKKYDDSHDKIAKMKLEKRKTLESQYKLRIEALERLAKVKDLSLEEGLHTL